MADGLFSQLGKLGLNVLEDMDLYEKEEDKSGNGENADGQQEVKMQESDFLLEKTYECPCCDNKFKVKAVKTGKVKLLESDSDLRPRYQRVDVLKYDCVVCNNCGYAALTRFFPSIRAAQIKAVREGISKAFKPQEESGDVYSYDEAITKHQLALANAVVKKSMMSEKAYICLKLAWLMRGKAENLEETATNASGASSAEILALKKEIQEINGMEKQYLLKAFEGFYAAMQKETFPICGMDEWTYLYLTAELARRVGENSICTRLLSQIIVAKGASSRIKDKARDLRKMINQ